MNGHADDPPPVERLIEAALFAPLDLTARVVEEIPSAVEKTKQQLVFARFLGKMAVGKGVAELRRRVDGSSTTEADPEPTDESTPTGETDTTAAATVEVDEPTGAGESAYDDDLALPDYDHLPATHVVAKLAGLSQAERDAIEEYERSHRNRRTVLGKLDQLRAG